MSSAGFRIILFEFSNPGKFHQKLLIWSFDNSWQSFDLGLENTHLFYNSQEIFVCLNWVMLDKWVMLSNWVMLDNFELLFSTL